MKELQLYIQLCCSVADPVPLNVCSILFRYMNSYMNAWLSVLPFGWWGQTDTRQDRVSRVGWVRGEGRRGCLGSLRQTVLGQTDARLQGLRDASATDKVLVSHDAMMGKTRSNKVRLQLSVCLPQTGRLTGTSKVTCHFQKKVENKTRRNWSNYLECVISFICRHPLCGLAPF